MGTWGKPLLIAGATSHASGAIASFPDGNGGPFRSLTVGIDPVQAGTGDPSPDNIRPISGWTGATIYHIGENFTKDRWLMGYIVSSETGLPIAGTSSLRDEYYCSPKILLSSEKKLYLDIQCGASGYRSRKYSAFDANDNLIEIVDDSTTGATTHMIKTYSFPANAAYVYVQVGIGNGTVNYATTTLTSYPVSWQSEAGTVYGGTLDVLTGILTVNTVYLSFDGSEDWYLMSGSGYFYLSVGAYGTIINDQAICSHLIDNPGISTSNNQTGFRVYNRSTSPRAAMIIVRFDETKQQTLEQFTQYLSEQALAGTPMQIVYKLTTPEVYQLTPTQVNTLVGQNNIWSDCGNVAVEYIKRSLVHMS